MWSETDELQAYFMPEPPTYWLRISSLTVYTVCLTGLISSCTLLGSESRSETSLTPSHHILGKDSDPTIGLDRPLEGHPRNGLLTLYIDGDGNPQASADPSPQNPVARRLASKDTGAWVIGRPCYQLSQPNVNCAPKLWRSARYGESVLMAMSDVIQRLLAHTGHNSIRLVGYSGGGTLAVLLSDRLSSITEVITVAAPLDLAAWARIRGSLPPEASLDPARHHQTGGASGITRYLHLVAGRDRVVPMQQAKDYSLRFPEEQFHTFPLYDHVCCWARDWSDIVKDIVDP